MKKIALLCCFMVLILTGCSGGNYTFYASSNGSIEELYVMPKTVKYFKDAGASDEQISSLYGEASNLIVAAKSQAEDSFKARLAKDTEDKKITAKEAQKLLNSVKVAIGQDANNIYLDFLYESTSSYQYFWGIVPANETGNSNVTIIKEIFVTKYETKGKTKFYNSQINVNGENVALGEYIFMEFEKLVKSHMSSEIYNKLEKPTLSYTYATDSSRLHSDADKTFKQGKIYFHSWEIKSDTIDRSITLYQVEANRGIWYVVALGGILVVVTMGALIIKIAGKKKNSQA